MYDLCLLKLVGSYCFSINVHCYKYYSNFLKFLIKLFFKDITKTIVYYSLCWAVTLFMYYVTF